MSHTPGPWRYVRDIDYWSIEPTGVAGKDNHEGNEADYHLVAAAPDLLAALEHSRQFVVTWHLEYADKPNTEHNLQQRQRITKAINMIDAAIAKAKGKGL